MSEIRYDRLYDSRVIAAPERLHRPDCAARPEGAPKAAKTCPFCEGSESMTPPEIFALRDAGTRPDMPGWHTRVVPNLYKAVQIETPDRRHFGAFEYVEGFGAHEVIIDTPRHCTSMTQWNDTEYFDWLRTLRARTADLRGDVRIAYLSLFKNEGPGAGATQPHSHTQLIGLPVIPEAERRRFERLYAYFREHGAALEQTELDRELQAGTRIVMHNDDFVVFCPFAAAYPFETRVVARRETGGIDVAGDDVLRSLGTLLESVQKRLERQLGCFDFNLVVSTPPLHAEHFTHDMVASASSYTRLSVRIMPRIYRDGGFEHATGMRINPVLPELAAKLLRRDEDG